MGFLHVKSYLYQTYKVIHGVDQTNAGQNRHYITNRKLVVHFPKPSSGSTIKGPLITVAIDDTVQYDFSQMTQKVVTVHEDGKR